MFRQRDRGELRQQIIVGRHDLIAIRPQLAPHLTQLGRVGFRRQGDWRGPLHTFDHAVADQLSDS